MGNVRRLSIAAAIALVACGSEPPPNERAPEGNAVLVPPPSPVEIDADETAPVSDEPAVGERSAEAAASVIETYFDLLGQRRYGEAWRLWSDRGGASGSSESDFAAGFDRFSEYRAEIGEPGRVEGAAGSLYVEIPVRVFGRLDDGSPFEMRGQVSLRRSNDIPGSTEEQRSWRIIDSDVRPRPARQPSSSQL